jgi:hypothetical protein
MVASRKSGSVSRRSVWPVGAVSKTMRLKRAYSGARRKDTTLEIATTSSTPGGRVSSSSPARRGHCCYHHHFHATMRILEGFLLIAPKCSSKVQT